jgi:hypothetical protein
MEVPAYYLHPHHYALQSCFQCRRRSDQPDSRPEVGERARSLITLPGQQIAMRQWAFASSPGRAQRAERGRRCIPALFTAGSGWRKLINLSGERSSYSHAHRLSGVCPAGTMAASSMLQRTNATRRPSQAVLSGPSDAADAELYDLGRASDAYRPIAGVRWLSPHEAAKRVIADAGPPRRVHTTVTDWPRLPADVVAACSAAALTS